MENDLCVHLIHGMCRLCEQGSIYSLLGACFWQLVNGMNWFYLIYFLTGLGIWFSVARITSLAALVCNNGLKQT